jgi:hypothetical protein
MKGIQGVEIVKGYGNISLITKAMFSSQKNLQNFSDSPSHRIFGHMHEALNIDKK